MHGGTGSNPIFTQAGGKSGDQRRGRRPAKETGAAAAAGTRTPAGVSASLAVTAAGPRRQ